MRRGHALLELVAVLAILGLTAAVAAPALRPLAGAPAGAAAAAQELSLLLRRARAAAEERDVRVVLLLDTRTGRAWYTTSADDEAFPADAGEVPLGGGVIAEAGGARVRYVFEPGGVAFAPEVRLRDGRQSLVVRVDRWTGAPHVDAR